MMHIIVEWYDDNLSNSTYSDEVDTVMFIQWIVSINSNMSICTSVEWSMIMQALVIVLVPRTVIQDMNSLIWRSFSIAQAWSKVACVLMLMLPWNSTLEYE